MFSVTSPYRTKLIFAVDQPDQEDDHLGLQSAVLFALDESKDMLIDHVRVYELCKGANGIDFYSELRRISKGKIHPPHTLTPPRRSFRM